MKDVLKFSHSIAESTEFDRQFLPGMTVIIQERPNGPQRVSRIASRSFLGKGLEVFITGRRTSIPCAWVYSLPDDRHCSSLSGGSVPSGTND